MSTKSLDMVEYFEHGYSFNETLTPQVLKGLFRAHFIQWWLWNLHRVQVLRLKYNLFIGWLWNLGHKLFQGEEWIWINYPLVYENWRKGCTRTFHLLLDLQKKTCDQLNLARIWMECLCGPLDGNNSIILNLHKISCQKCANHNRLATLHLDYVN